MRCRSATTRAIRREEKIFLEVKEAEGKAERPTRPSKKTPPSAHPRRLQETRGSRAERFSAGARDPPPARKPRPAASRSSERDLRNPRRAASGAPRTSAPATAPSRRRRRRVRRRRRALPERARRCPAREVRASPRSPRPSSASHTRDRRGTRDSKRKPPSAHPRRLPETRGSQAEDPRRARDRRQRTSPPASRNSERDWRTRKLAGARRTSAPVTAPSRPRPPRVRRTRTGRPGRARRRPARGARASPRSPRPSCASRPRARGGTPAAKSPSPCRAGARAGPRVARPVVEPRLGERQRLDARGPRRRDARGADRQLERLRPLRHAEVAEETVRQAHVGVEDEDE